MKFSPGPWKVGATVSSGGRAVYTPIVTHAGKAISCAGVYGHHVDGSTANPTGRKWPAETHRRFVGDAEAMANARLIAAAPEMYAALDAFVRAFGPLAEDYENTPLGEAKRLAVAALSRVRTSADVRAADKSEPRG